MADKRELQKAMRRIDVDYTRRNSTDHGGEEFYMKVECDCGALLMEERPVGNSSRDTVNLLDMVTAALEHRKTCIRAQH